MLGPNESIKHNGYTWYGHNRIQLSINALRGSEKDNFTCVSLRRRSVVDYVLVPYSILHSVTEFSVKTLTDLIEEYSVNLPSRDVPDHLVLLCTLELSDYIVRNLSMDTISLEKLANGTHNADVPRRKYKVSSVPINILIAQNVVQHFKM